MRGWGGEALGSARASMNETTVYRTKSGMIFRVKHGEDGHLSVEVLREAEWQAGSIGMVGSFIGPYAWGVARDLTGNYQAGLLWLVLPHLAAATIVLVVRHGGRLTRAMSPAVATTS